MLALNYLKVNNKGIPFTKVLKKKISRIKKRSILKEAFLVGCMLMCVLLLIFGLISFIYLNWVTRNISVFRNILA